MAVRFTPHVEAKPPVWTPPLAGLGRQRKIALLGSHTETLRFAPWDDPSWELWGHSSSRGWYVRPPDRYFDLHREECWTKTNRKGEKYLQFLRTNTVPIYMQERFPTVPASVRYPLERVQAEYRSYFTGHAAYMIALALLEGVTHLGFFGVNYGKDQTPGADAEYSTQRGSCEYWMGIAEARGVRLVLPKGSTLLADPKELYGYESHDAEGVLVASYQRRTWLKPEGGDATPRVITRLANGLAAPPPMVAEAMAREEAEHPRPAWACV